MPAQTRSRGKTPATAIYKPTPAAPKQQEFPPRRRSAKTYGRPKPGRKLKQETLTQMDFTSSAIRDFVDLIDTDDDDKEEEENLKFKLEPSEPAKKRKSKTNSTSNRRRTVGDEQDAGGDFRQSKRRKTLGDSPNPSVSSSFHTQTLTQMLSTAGKDEDPWQIEDSQDDEDSNSILETPKKESGYQSRNEAQEGTTSAVPSLVKSTTPANRQKRTEIPSSQSPATPMLLRYSPASHNSPLMTKSTNVAAPSPILKNPRKTPRSAVIPDSYSTVHESSPATPTQKSTVKATPSKRLRFDIPEDKENITPGRTKPKSPKPKTQATGRRPLQEVPDSDEELDEDPDETEYETESEEYGAHDPESPTPRRFQNIVPPVNDLELELGSPETVHSPLEEAAEPVTPSESQLENHEPGMEPYDQVPSGVEHGPQAPPVSRLGEGDLHLEPPNALNERRISNEERNRRSSPGVEAQMLEPPQTEQGVVKSTLASAVEQTVDSAASEQDENDDIADDLPPSQNYLYTQGLESQRLPLDSIHALGPQTPRSDIMVSLHPEHIARIVDRTKNHEFRAWKIPEQVSRIWVYITRPESHLKYMCIFGEPKTPGEIQDDKGIGNVDFNQGKKTAKFAYEVLQVYELNNPVSLDEMKRKGWVSGAPQKYTYIPPAVVGELTANLRCALFDETSQSEDIRRQGVSESQELKAQLQSDADYSTQHYSETTDEIIPASQSPRKSSGTSETVTDTSNFVRPPLTRIRSISSNHGSPSLPNQRQGGIARPSQATTVSQVSSSPVISPGKSSRHPIPLSSETVGSSPTVVRRTNSSLRSSQFPTRSQMLPDSLLDGDFHEPPPIVWDSADEHSD
ncbi:hypothetical protein NUW58_g4900 [Xylaria curta]|uniref:Uncharacterized protein n=1 Tax=Xylaria curta TaxID=42375 RepID=A0ACC1P5Y3_9PEZI|nr:hypothetical protein NUW58_g4900 [Xylaria curta]